jgi:hypothetical protein
VTPYRFQGHKGVREKAWHGSVEMDAVSPAILRSLVRGSIEKHTNPERLRVLKLAEEQERDLLRASG